MSINQAASEVRIAKAIGYRIIAKKAVRAVLWLLVIGLVVYGIVAGSMTRYVATNLGTLKIVSTNFPGGNAQPGSIVAIDPTGGYDNNFFKNLLTAVTPHSSVMIAEIAEGPYGSPDWKAYGFTDKKPVDKLSGEYIAECLQGCPDGISFVIVRADQIMGIPVGL